MIHNFIFSNRIQFLTMDINGGEYVTSVDERFISSVLSALAKAMQEDLATVHRVYSDAVVREVRLAQNPSIEFSDILDPMAAAPARVLHALAKWVVEIFICPDGSLRETDVVPTCCFSYENCNTGETVQWVHATDAKSRNQF